MVANLLGSLETVAPAISAFCFVKAEETKGRRNSEDAFTHIHTHYISGYQHRFLCTYCKI